MVKLGIEEGLRYATIPQSAALASLDAEEAPSEDGFKPCAEHGPFHVEDGICPGCATLSPSAPTEREKAELVDEDAAYKERVATFERLSALWESNGRKHVWIKGDDSKIDDFVYDFDNHNGPGCEVCGHFFCEHCTPFDAEDAKPCPGPDVPTKSRIHELLEKFILPPAPAAE